MTDTPATLRDHLQAILLREEGERLVVYDDATGKPIRPGSVVVGHPTIGIGRALDVHGISHAEALALLDGDIAAILPDMPRIVPAWPRLSLARQACLAAMRFQLGPNGLVAFRTTLSRVEASDFAGAADAMLASAWAQQTPARALRMAQMMREG